MKKGSREGRLLTFVNRRVNMKLVRIARERWDVLAVMDEREDCQVLDFLLAPGQDRARQTLLIFLRMRLPVEGPPAHNRELCKSLGDGIFEFRRQPKGPKVRVLFFYDDGCRIICTNAFCKAERTPRSGLELAKDLRQQYFRAKLLGRLHIEENRDG
jgi:hypothetical protein